MPICVNCRQYLENVATIYSFTDSRIELCPACSNLSDVYIGSRNLSLLSDLVLLKPQVLRHLLYNRRAEPAQSERFRSLNPGYRHNNVNTTTHLVKLGGILVIADAFVSWVHFRADGMSFMKLLIAATLDALSYHIAVIFAVRILTVRSVSNLQISLAIFYSSFAKLFLLLLLIIADPMPQSSSTVSSVPDNFLTGMHLTDDNRKAVWNVYTSLDDDRIDRPWIVNTVVGGMSAGFGLRVLLNTSPITSTIIILSGWIARSVTLELLHMYF
ncbi:hypothetical protein E3Q03_01249 [Wallemia mellicola]|uniref:Protein ARV n=1 Tax=Wallemia mellicola TaxID=1708541 RepID=A0AB74KGR2_9BASI|nr:hypothetical protein E3Q03_01249 [Wallemia mellicola]